MRQRRGERSALVVKEPPEAVDAQHAEIAASHTPTALRLRWLPPLWLFAALAIVLFAVETHLDPQDIGEYQCYALTFWHGAQATAALPQGSCLVPLASLNPLPFHELPREYGPLALLVFSPPLLAPLNWYLPLFVCEMLAIILGLTWLLNRYGAYGAGHALLLYLMLGSTLTATGRFDIVPGACCLLALLAIQRAKRQQGDYSEYWSYWAYAALAVGTLLKFFPALLLPILLIETWRRRDPAKSPFSWRLWRGFALFAGIVALGEGLTFALNPAALLAPLHFGLARCVQVESVPATLTWLLAQVTGARVGLPYTYNSTCLVAPGVDIFSPLCLALALVGIACTLWLFWRHTLSMAVAACLLLCLAMLGSKVFSPQYLLWVSPLVAWEFGLDGAALTAWGLICAATSLCYPLSYHSLLLLWTKIPPTTAVPVTAALRNILLTALVVLILRRPDLLRRDASRAVGKAHVDGRDAGDNLERRPT
ncbi:MAG: glycosyltransferase 87 family protein [Ktedonobacterales bacterium]